MINIGLLGCGRIGKMHADNIAYAEGMSLAAVYDVDNGAASAVADKHNVASVASAEEVFSHPDIDGVLIATATPTHADYIELAVKHEKPALCEKPIDLSLQRVNQCAATVKSGKAPIQLGFNRRFDSGHRAAREALLRGDIGTLQQVIITSRDPEMPPDDYYRSAGGLLRDMTIHDFDLARFMLGEEPTEVFAVASRLIDKKLMDELDDHDTAMIIMTTASGKQCHINNSRTARYGYDQRVELLGDKGMVVSDNRTPHNAKLYTAEVTEARIAYEHFFIERYAQSFHDELRAFAKLVKDGGSAEVGFEDGRQALILAEAAYISLAEKRAVAVSEVEGA